MERKKPTIRKPSGAQAALLGSFPMKKRTISESSERKPGNPTGAPFGNAALDLIIKDAYRRHSRGRLARAAMASCLGI